MSRRRIKSKSLGALGEPFSLRLPVGLQRAIEKSARERGTTLSDAIRQTLAGAHEFSGGLSVEKRLAAAEERLAKIEAWYQIHGARF